MNGMMVGNFRFRSFRLENFQLTTAVFTVYLLIGAILAQPAWRPTALLAQVVASSGPSQNPLRPGDAIRISISREAELGGEFIVDEAGQAALPMIGVRDVVGVPPAELKRQLQAAYSEQLRNQVVQITLLRRISVLGAVNKPGLYHVDPTMALPDVVALAGGATGGVRVDEVRIIRDGREIEVRLNDMTMEQVHSGDHIVVGERSWVARNARAVIGVSLSALALLLRYRL